MSELWKNAFDAYARSVALHIFDGTVEVAAVVDDGAGMSASDFLNRWLVIGTESKIEDDDSEPPETFGLPHRVRQGEKGIGRLSAAFLAPVALVVAKKSSEKFAAVLVDWRLFENPFLLIEDINLPVVEFDQADELLTNIPEMASVLRSNLPKDLDIGKTSSRSGGSRELRLLSGWERFNSYERLQGIEPTTYSMCQTWWDQPFPVTSRHLEEWPVFIGLGDHGTALFLIGAHHELAQWVRGGNSDDDERVLVTESLRRTLSGFIDPFSTDAPELGYEVLLHFGNRSSRVIASHDVFGYEDLLALEHVIDGAFDDRGVFRGRVIAFGQDKGIQEFIPRRPLPTAGRDHVGAFRFCVGTFEQVEASSTHIDSQFKLLKDQAERFAGLAVYRDGLRVMPYGRPESDFFRLEERRGRHAGRYFFAHRRVFGRVAISRQTNPYLKDKAGREGLVENRARREMQIVVIELLVDFAQRFFGSDAPLRKEYLSEIEARNKAARESAEKVRSGQKTTLRQFIKTQAKAMAIARSRVTELKSKATKVQASSDGDGLSVLGSEFQELARNIENLKPPLPPRKLGNLEEPYREYRDSLESLLEEAEGLRQTITRLDAEIDVAGPEQVIERRAQSNVKSIDELLDKWLTQIIAKLDLLKSEWASDIASNRPRYAEVISPYLQETPSKANLISTLNLLDRRRVELEEELRGRYDALVRALDRLQEGIDLEGALSVIDDDRAELEDRLKEINQVAQLGISVEIIGHELETLDAEVRGNLNKLPLETRKLKSFKQAYEAHAALTEKLKFLSPLKIAGYRNREVITGAEIGEYVREFFDRRLRENRVAFAVTDEFKLVHFSDLRSRIYPVFINLVNNSLYWLSFVTDRRIILDFVDGLVVVADSGAGVDPDDISRLFTLFFTRRTKGRGIGLFLCRANLAVARHKIRYATQEDPHVLPGANFVIEFRGLPE